MGGSDTVGNLGAQPGLNGVLGTPAAGNIPGGRYGSTVWTDSKGHVWLFGGLQHQSNQNLNGFNDLWEFNPSSNEWAWMGGSNAACSDGVASAVYGTLGKPALGNTPGCRYYASGSTDSDGNLWLFGGKGTDSSGTWDDLNDVWEFSPATSEWTWIGGSSTGNGNYAQQSGVYGTPGVAAVGNIPSTRFAASSWTDNSGNFWLFGGSQTGEGIQGDGEAEYLRSL